MIHVATFPDRTIAPRAPELRRSAAFYLPKHDFLFEARVRALRSSDRRAGHAGAASLLMI
jgi:hypothetical protein